jgi:RNA polymerase sigma-70 factor, ECF subfamily
MSPANHPQEDAGLWAEWSRQHGRAVWGYLWGLVRRHDVADDLTQEVFCRAWQARTTYHEQGTLRAYLLRIANRLAIDHFRKRGREVTLSEESWKQVEPEEHGGPADNRIEGNEVLGQLAAALDRLSLPQRRVLLLRYYGELSFAEIAAMMGCPVSTALSHCHRGLIAMRSLLVETDK